MSDEPCKHLLLTEKYFKKYGYGSPPGLPWILCDECKQPVHEETIRQTVGLMLTTRQKREEVMALTVIPLECVSLKALFEGWRDIDDLTVGKTYVVTVLESHREWKFTQCEVTNDAGERMRVLGGHFTNPRKG